MNRPEQPILPETLIEALNEWVRTRMGRHFGSAGRADLVHCVGAAARELGLPDTAAYAQSVLDNSLTESGYDHLIAHLTIGETYFFRESPSFTALEEVVLPKLIAEKCARGDRSLKIWSAACCTGEEAYSIAISLHRLLPNLPQWDITLTGTDINSQFLNKARLGIYSPWSFRNAPPWLCRDFFAAHDDGTWELTQRIRTMVQFEQFNLLEERAWQSSQRFTGVDLVFCRNVLMYFDQNTQGEVLARIERALHPGGWLAVGLSEVTDLITRKFSSFHTPGAVLFRKRSMELDRGRTDPGEMASEPANLTPWARKEKEAEASVSAPGAITVCPTPSRKTQDPRISTPAPAVVSPKESSAVAVGGAPATSTDESQPSRTSPVDQAAALARLGNIDGALALLERENSRHPVCPAAAVLLASMYADCGRLQEALNQANLAVHANGLDSHAQYTRAIILQELGEVEAAKSAFRRVLYLDPRCVMAHVALARFRGSATPRHTELAVQLLRESPPDAVVPETDGMTATALLELLSDRGHGLDTEHTPNPARSADR